jgi:hypothetical protein
MHSTYSDGSGTYDEIVHAAGEENLDVLIITDHNVLVIGSEGYRNVNGKRILVLTGEEIHDQDRNPQKNHILALGITEELAQFADEPQLLIDHIQFNNGLSFIAHPIDLQLKLFNETNISWEDWGVKGFTGLEIWNGFSEIKNVIKNKFDALLFGFFPELIAHGPHAQTIQIWDDLISKGQRVVAIGGSDAHASRMRLGPLQKIIFPYQFHFSTINTHLLVSSPLSGDVTVDTKMVYQAFAEGHAFVAYDLPAPTAGFRFFAQGKDNVAIMGDEIRLNGSISIQVHVPAGGETSLIKNGQIIRTTTNDNLIYVTNEAGVYRVEVHRNFLGKRRGWIFSNPIYVISD